MAVNDGGPAFPSTNDVTVPGTDIGTSGHAGMTLRDYFAAKAMAGMCASAEKGKHSKDMMPLVADFSYRYADAMLAEREKAK